MQQLLDEIHGHRHYRPSPGPQRQGTPRCLHRPTIDLRQQGLQIGRYQVHYPPRQRLAGGHGHAFPHRLLGPFRVPAPLLGQGTGGGRRIADHLVHHHWLDLAPQGHRMGGADVGAGGHGCHMGCQGDEQPRRGCPRPSRGHVDHDRQGAVQNGLGHLSHRPLQPTWGVQLQYHGRGPLRLCSLQSPLQVTGGERIDDPPHRQYVDVSLSSSPDRR